MKTLICLCVLSLVAIAVASPLSREEALVQSLFAQGGMDGEGRGNPPIYEEPIAVVEENDAVIEGSPLSRVEALVQSLLAQGVERDNEGNLLVYEEPITTKKPTAKQVVVNENDAIIDAVIQLVLENRANIMLEKFGKKKWELIATIKRYRKGDRQLLASSEC